MKQDIILKQRIGVRLARAGLLSKVFAVQSFAKSGHELTPEQFTVLMALKDNDGMYQRQLANMVLKDRPNINRIVSILEDGGYITSQIATDGRQVKKLFITKSGVEICEKILPTIFDIWSQITLGLDEKEVDNFINTLEKIENNLREKTLLQI